MSVHLARAEQLVQLERYELAEQELHGALAADPQNAQAHNLMAVCLLEREQFDEATQHATTAIALAPDWPWSHYSLARVYFARNRIAEAKATIEEAIRLDPEEATFFSLLGHLHFHQREWSLALEAAERGLRLDAEHLGCNNLRAMSLVKLGRGQEADAVLNTVLAAAPDNSHSHANKGWSLLEKSQPRQALEHFSEALRLDADNEWARMGMLEALKARYFVYRWMLKYFLWMAKLGERYQWAVIIGMYVLYQVLRNAAKANPALVPFVTPLAILYAVFVFLSWLSRPLFNLLLRCNRFGRAVLLPEHIAQSNLVGGTLCLAVVSFVVFILTESPAALVLALVAGLWSIPAASIYNCTSGWPRRWMILLAAAIGVLGIAAVACTYLDLPVKYTLLTTYLVGTLLSSLAANALAQAEVRR